MTALPSLIARHHHAIARRMVSARVHNHQQRRGFLDWMTNYPDRVRCRISALKLPATLLSFVGSLRRGVPLSVAFCLCMEE